MSQTFSNRWTTDPQYIELLNYLINKTKDAKPPINIYEFIRDFKKKSGTALTDTCLKSRIQRMRAIIHSFEHIETDTKVRMLFVFSAPVNRDFLQKLSNDAHVEVDENDRITHYKSERLELKRYFRLPTVRDSKVYWTTDMECIDLLNYLIEATENVKSPIKLARLARDFKEKTGAFQTAKSLQQRIDRMRKHIHSFEHIETDTKVRILFALSVSVNEDLLQELSYDAHVEVDAKNRITHYKSESLELEGFHRLSTARDTKHYWTTDMECIELLNYLIEATENVESPMNLAELARDFKEKSGTLQAANSLEKRIIQVRDSIHRIEHIDTNTKVKLLFALSAPGNAQFLAELEERAFVQVDKMNRITYYKAIDDGLELRGDHSVLAKLSTAHFDSELSHRAPTFETPTSSKRKADIWVSSISKKTLSSPDYSSLELQVDYDTNYSIDDQVKLEPFCGSIQEDLNGIVEDKDIQQISKPMGTPIKNEEEEPIEVKPETSHNSKMKLFKAMQSLILFLNTPSLSNLQSKIYQKIQKLGGPDEVILNNEISLTIELLISRMINLSVVNLSNNVESVNLSNFLCYLEAAILNSKMSGVEGLVQNISKLTEESQNKRVPMEKVANAVCATLDIDCF